VSAGEGSEKTAQDVVMAVAALGMEEASSTILAMVWLRIWQTRFELGLDLKSRFRFRHYTGLDLDHSPSSQVGWTWTPGSKPGP